MSVPKSAVRRVSRPFLFLRFRQVSDLFSCPPRAASSSPRDGTRDEGRFPIRELLQPGGNGKWRNGWRAESRDGRRSNGGESPTARFVSSRMLLLPSSHPRLRPRGFFLLRHSYFFYMPLSICSSNPPPSARTGHGAPLFNLTFSILSFFFPFLSRNRLTRKQPKQPFEKRATIRRQLSAIPLQSGYFSPVVSWRCLRPTIPRFALADLLRVVGDGNLILYEERS